MANGSDKVRYDDLPLDVADRIVEALAGYVSDARKARIESALAARTRELLVVLEDIHSDHNASAVLRSAEAFGLIEVHTVPRTTEFRLSRKVSLGTHKWLDLRRGTSARETYAGLQARGYEVWAAAVHGDSVPLQQIPFDRPVALVFGNEHEGLTRDAVEAADGVFKIPMTGFAESLNIAVAAAVALHDQLERRRQAKGLSPLPPDELRQIRAAWYALSVRAAPQLLQRASLPRPFMSLRPVQYFHRHPEGGTTETVSVEQDAEE